MGQADGGMYADEDDGYEMSSAIDPSYQLLLAVILYCIVVSFLVFLVVKNGQPRRFSRLVEKASQLAGKIGKALRVKRRSKVINDDDEGDRSKLPYQPFDSDGKASPTQQTADISQSGKKSDGLLGTPTESYRWPGLCNLVNEMLTIHKLAASWLFSSVISHSYNIAVVFLISHYIGEDDAIAFATVEFYLYMFHLISGGVFDSFYRNANVAIGSDDHELVGQLANISMIFAGVASVPAIVFSLFWMDDFLLWLGFDDNIAAKGQDYALLSSCLALFEGVNGIWWSLLDLTGHEIFNAGFDFLEAASGMTFTAVAIVHYNFDLWKFGLLNIVHGVAWAIISMLVVAFTGWLKPYYEGMFSTASLGNSKATNDMLRTAVPLILVSVSLDLEWRILSLMIDVAHGPAEAAAWILLDYVWTLLETWTGTFADAAQQIVTNYLYSGSLHQARATTNATLVYGFFYSCLESLFLVLISDWVIGILTPDETLMTIMKGIVPYLAIGNPFVSIGTIASSLNESQGRYWIGVCFYWLSGAFITIPVAAILSFVVGVNAEGIAAAVVMGCTTSGLAHVGLLVEADYEKVIASLKEDEDSNDEDYEVEYIESGKNYEEKPAKGRSAD